MTLTTKLFKQEFEKTFEGLHASNIKESSSAQQYTALANFIKVYSSDNWNQTNQLYKDEQFKQVYYFSMEFLPGRMLKSNLLNLGILDIVRAGIAEMGLDFEAIVKSEVDPALGNGGLGRLASCFMDSIASLGIPGNGNGIRYRYGLFQQKFVDGYQVELPDNWLRNGNIWEVRKENKAVMVRFGGEVYLKEDGGNKLRPIYSNTQNILAVPYDTGMIGYENDVVNTLRLWSAEIPPEEEINFKTSAERAVVNQITEVLYPDDSNYEGQLLRLRQEYFFTSAGIQSIIRFFKRQQLPWSEFPNKIAIHVNDTHPALCVPELMRILLDEEGMSWEKAWDITKKSISYTNHTIMQEAMEKWPVHMVQELIPRIYQIIEAINQRHIDKKIPLYGEELTYRTTIISDGNIKMANLAIIGSHSVNGVAQLHTDILKEEILRDFYEMYPSKFNNKTNGITQRRWLHLANEKLTQLIDDKIGKEWKTNPAELRQFKAYSKDKKTLKQLSDIKLENKKRFAAYVKEKHSIELDPTALFDVQIKRLHAYKRQLLNALHILDRYLKIKNDPKLDLQPRVFIFGAKAAPSYIYAKQIIKFINALAKLVNNDPDVGDKMKVVFIENYGVSLAELIIPAADISEQISLAGKEASGTSNMKLMLNGALTMATLDGANIEIKDLVGEDNIFLFGLTNDEVNRMNREGHYSSKAVLENNPRLNKVLECLVDGTVPDIVEEGRVIYDSLVQYNDEYYVLQDFESFVAAQERADTLYQNQELWNQKALINIASSGPFSADFTIMRYADEIWNVKERTINKKVFLKGNQPL
ncbi:glycogen/starch/alpha-glucan phosphorylase [Carnobacterium pleistocenium]|uniref:glycogen/starch/alpha-glucan phosphorylase n=1 Tax=Carnobacterium pleistocenium TaxID=181073 RepID=UPI00054EA673|nr:glycogen/starch/alpha-glucan phosphorylase [Carnobacterium pleistocenium]